ncbi:MAG: hypothetical protein PHS12_04540, partial [Candidatus Omnitrophica bacterium]|nr:hypothetical protein [Candidatus Omnitrophota bacterium]
FLVDARCAPHDFITIGQVGNFHYVVGSITSVGYDIRAMAINSALADHNYQVLTGGMLRRSDTPGLGDTNFKSY